ncbi:multidrug resistance-associated 5 isoform X1 [Paramuricea clavata]|uniref:Multidrug resistance-associated 5 isoform X1 n=1 Tax=Paramuricea clavata TaxID=317549 RepID=A0A7D9HWG4_PARCT|nr:multidrug resistance-associated 5 isoform X1 [Paramuricea clavata]
METIFESVEPETSEAPAPAVSDRREKLLKLVDAGYERQKLENTNNQLADIIITKFSELMEELDAVKDAERMKKELEENSLLRKDLKNLVSYVTPYIPLIGILNGGITVGKHVISIKLESPKGGICLGLPTGVTNDWFHTYRSWAEWSEERARRAEEEEILAEARIGEMEMLEEMQMEAEMREALYGQTDEISDMFEGLAERTRKDSTENTHDSAKPLGRPKFMPNSGPPSVKLSISPSVTSSGTDFSVLINNYHQRLQAEENEDEDDEEDNSIPLEEIVGKRTLSAQSNGDSQPNTTEEKKETNDKSKMNGVEKGKDILMKAEERNTGTVSLSTYLNYCKAAGGFCVTTSVILLLFATTVLRVFTDFWLGRWINDGNGNETAGSSGKLNDNPDLNFYATIYGSSLVVLIILFVVKCFIFVSTVLRASSNLHNQVFRAVTKSPMEFFDTTPIGQILNRFSKDIDEIDTRLPLYIEMLILNLSLISMTFLIIELVS